MDSHTTESSDNNEEDTNAVNAHTDEHAISPKSTPAKDYARYFSEYYGSYFKKVEEVIEHCKQEVFAYKGEKFVSGWVVVSINRWAQLQERVVLVTTGAYYRVKYDFNDMVILRSHRVPIPDLSSIQVGWLHQDTFTPIETLLSSTPDANAATSTEQSHFAIRIFANGQYRTFCAHYPGARGREFVELLVASIEKVRAHTFSSDTITHTVPTIRVTNNVPILAFVHNKLQLGMWLKLYT